MIEQFESWMPKILIVIYFLLGLANIYLHKVPNALYWIGAAILTIGVKLMSK